MHIEKSDVSKARVLASNARNSHFTNHYALYVTPGYAYARFVGLPTGAKARILGACARTNFLNSFA